MMSWLRDIEGRLGAATPGPWFAGEPKRAYSEWPLGAVVAAVARGPQHRIWSATEGGTYPAADMEFIAAARTDLEFAMQLLEVARDYVQGYRKHLKGLSLPIDAVDAWLARLEHGPMVPR